jgi:hypothetical protein
MSPEIIMERKKTKGNCTNRREPAYHRRLLQNLKRNIRSKNIGDRGAKKSGNIEVQVDSIWLEFPKARAVPKDCMSAGREAAARAGNS